MVVWRGGGGIAQGRKVKGCNVGGKRAKETGPCSNA